jgi:hypothetical protein
VRDPELEIASTVKMTASMSAVVQKDIRVAKRGFLQAVTRLQTAAAQGGLGSDDVYISIAEAGDWLDTLTDKTSLSDDIDVQAVVFGRHRTHHHLASIAYYDEEQGTHLWRPETQLPEPEREWQKDERHKAFYAKRLASKPVLEVFERLVPLVESATPR